MVLSLKDDFLTPKVSSILATAELGVFVLTNTPQTSSLSQYCLRLRRIHWDSQNAQAALAKIVIRSKTISFVILFIPQ